MRTFQYYIPQLKADVQRTYNRHGILINVTIVNGNELEQVDADNISFSLRLQDFLERSKKQGAKVTEVHRTVTFDDFWKLYPEKNGGRTVAQKKWDALSEANRLDAFDYLKTLIENSNRRGIAFPYAQTYFNQKRWLIK